MALLREWQLERVVPLRLLHRVADEAVHLELARVEAQPPVARLVVHLVAQPPVARAEAQPLVAHPEAARVEAQPWDPTYRVIRRYPPPTEAWEPLVRVVAEARQQPWARRTKSVREVKKKR